MKKILILSLGALLLVGCDDPNHQEVHENVLNQNKQHAEKKLEVMNQEIDKKVETLEAIKDN